VSEPVARSIFNRAGHCPAFAPFAGGTGILPVRFFVGAVHELSLQTPKKINQNFLDFFCGLNDI